MKKRVLFVAAGAALLIVAVLLAMLFAGCFARWESMDVDVLKLSTEQLTERAALVVRGKVVDRSRSFLVRPYGTTLSDTVFTDYTLEVSEVLRGNAAPGEQVSIRCEGGKTLFKALEVNGIATPRVGQEVVAFLYRPGMGGGTFTRGDHYRIVGGTGWFVAAEEGTLVGIDGNDKREEHGFLQEITLASAKYPINENWQREEYIAHLVTQRDQGVLSEEEYEAELAKLEQYAEVL